MKDLHQLQRNFQLCLLDGDSAAVLPAITPAGRAAPDRQLSVYNNAYRSRLREVLEIDYPVLAAALGDGFDELTAAYIDAHPSHGFSLRSFGAQLAAFLKRQPDYCEIPVLAELATFEWTLGQAFDAADDKLVMMEDMEQIAVEAWPVLRLDFHPSVHRIDFAWNTPTLWHAHKSRAEMPEVKENGTTVPWLIWRKELTVQFRSLEDLEPLMFDIACQGGNFEEMCEALRTQIPVEEVPLRAASILKRWIGDGLVSRTR
jgi:hypothetical protein